MNKSVSAQGLVDDPILQWVTFKLDNESYGINVMRVQEVLRYTEIAPVPGAPSYVLGIINLRGNVVTVIDTRQRFGLVPTEVNDNTRIVIIEADKQVTAPNVGNEESAKFIQGVCNKNGELLILVAVIVLAILWAGTLGFLLRYVRQQRELATRQVERDAVRDRRILELAKRVDHFQQSAVRVGDEVHELRSVLAPLPDKLSALEQRDPSSLSFAQAAKLVGMGATVDELTQSCGLTQAEAQLMSRLHKDS
eukprot:gene14609-17719_t